MNRSQQYLAQEFLDDYQEMRMDRRSMLRRVTLLLGGAAAAVAWLQSQGLDVSAREAESAAAQPIERDSVSSGVTIDPADPAIQGGMLEFSSSEGTTYYGYIARPAASSMTGWPGVVIVHENGGLQEHFKDLARRYAKEGFVALAVDLYSRWGGSPSAPDQPTISAAMASVPMEQNAADVSEYVGYLMTQPDVLPGGVGLTGFCIGGGIAWWTAVQDSNVAAVVPYYGDPVPPAEKIPEMRAPVLAIYGALDQRVNPSIPGMEDALKASGKTYRIEIYEGAQHAFFNDSRTRYHQPSAEVAWVETLAWFRQYLSTA